MTCFPSFWCFEKKFMEVSRQRKIVSLMVKITKKVRVKKMFQWKKGSIGQLEKVSQLCRKPGKNLEMEMIFRGILHSISWKSQQIHFFRKNSLNIETQRNLILGKQMLLKI